MIKEIIKKDQKSYVYTFLWYIHPFSRYIIPKSD